MIFGLARIWRILRQHKELGFFLVVVVLIASVLGNALTFYAFDSAANPDLTPGDALWYSVISITTIGYGDFSATTVGARLGTAIFVVLFGLAAFTSAVGMGIDRLLERRERERLGMIKVKSKGHLLIINPSTADRARRIIEEYVEGAGHDAEDVVIVSDRFESLPFKPVPRVLRSRLAPGRGHLQPRQPGAGRPRDDTWLRLRRPQQRQLRGGHSLGGGIPEPGHQRRGRVPSTSPTTCCSRARRA